jgi:hypothetical protein
MIICRHHLVLLCVAEFRSLTEARQLTTADPPRGPQSRRGTVGEVPRAMPVPIMKVSSSTPGRDRQDGQALQEQQVGDA